MLLIDNYDSFTYNVWQQVAGLGVPVKVISNDGLSVRQIAALRPQRIIISPGSGGPDESGVSRQVIERFYKTVPILGICLGHQCIGAVFGSRIVRLPEPMHGTVSRVRHTGEGIFQGVANPFPAARYHSLAIDHTPKDFVETATADGVVMAIQHRELPVYGIQFHPESFLTPSGKRIMENFLR